MKTFRFLLLLLVVLPVQLHAEEWTDVTGFIKNPTFKNDRKFGWSYEDYEYWAFSTGWECTEVPNATFNVWQTLKGLPAGHYRLRVQAFYRDGSQEEAYAKHQKGTEALTAFLYVNDKKVPLVSLYTYSVDWPLDEYRWKANDSTYFCHHPFDATLAFGDSAYWNSIEFDANGDVLIGIRNDNYVKDNWCVFDNFTLEYQGTTVIATGLNISLPKTTMESGERQMVTTKLSPTNTTIKNISWSSSDAFICAVNQNGEVEARNPGKATLTAMTTDGSEISRSIEVTVTEKVIEDTRKWKDITHAIINPNFEEEDKNGWSTMPDDRWRAVDGLMTTFGQTWYKFYQVIEDLPKGHYRLSMQGFSESFYYPGDFFRYIEGDSTSYAYLYADNVRKTLIPFSSYVHTTDDGEYWHSYDNGKHYYPGDPASQAIAFAEGAWLNSLEFDVEKDHSNVTIGVGLDEYRLKRNGATFTNFRLETSDDIDLGRSYKITVLDVDGNDISKDVTVSWTNDDGETLGKGTAIGGIKRNVNVFYSITLDEKLGRIYREVKNHEVDPKEPNISIQLEKIEKLALQGQVKAQGQGISRAMVNISQWLNSKYLYEVSERTNADGTFNIEVYADSTEIIITSDGYTNRKIVIKNPATDQHVNLGNINMQAVQGKTIAINLSYQNATYEGQDANVMEHYFNLRDITYTVKNLTKNSEVSGFALQNSNIVLPTGNDKGDKMKVTLHSLNDNFADIVGSATIADNDTAKIDLRLIAYGSIEVNYENIGDDAILAMLYNKEGHLVMRSVCNTSRMTFSTLPEGTYTLVTMEYRGTIGTLTDMADFKTLGLERDIDYTQSTASVKTGVISRLTVYGVPELDASKFDYISEKTSYLPNKMTLIAGTFVTMTANVGFKEEYVDKTDNVKLLVTIPDGCEFIENSVVIGTRPLNHSLNGNLLTIQLDKTDLNQNIRFCIKPVDENKYQTSASVEFDCDGEKTQPIGQISFNATSGEFYAPKVTRTPNFTIGGYGLPGSEVEVYDGDRLVARAAALGKGRWVAECQLHDASNLSVHELQARYRMEGVEVLKSAIRRVTYDINGIVPETVTMINVVHSVDMFATPVHHSAGGSSNARGNRRVIQYLTETNETVFDYKTIFGGSNSYTYWPEEPKFTFLIKFNDNDTTVVKNVVLYVHTTDGSYRALPAQYDGKQDCFVTSDKFHTGSLPSSISLDYTALTEPLFDAAKLRRVFEEYDPTKAEAKLEEDLAAVDDFFDTPAAEDYEQVFDYMASCLGISLSSDNNDKTEDLSQYSDEELLAKLSDILDNISNIDNWTDNNNSQLFTEEELKQFSIEKKSCEGIDLNSLTSKGYLEVTTTEDTKIYIYQDEAHFNYIDPAMGLMYACTAPSITNNARRSKASEFFGDVNTIVDVSLTIGDYGVDKILEYNESELKQAKKLAKKTKDSHIKAFLKNKRATLKESSKTFTKTKAGIGYASKASNLFGAAITIWDFKEKMDEQTKFANMIDTLQLKCKTKAGVDALSKAREDAKILIEEAGLVNMGMIALSTGAKAGVTTSISSAGLSLIASLGLTAAECEASYLYGQRYDKVFQNIKNDVTNAARLCNDLPPLDLPYFEVWDIPYKIPKDDPSGFVYEAVPTNRLADVKASIFVQNEDEEPEFWDAEYYDEVNPQITNQTGLYAWDVPQGLWKVVFEKEGYETTETEWLPVPPPQLEINIPMTQAIAPQVSKAAATESGVTLEFSKYLIPASLTSSKRISLEHKGHTVDGEITLLNAEENPYNNEEYVSKVKFVTSSLLPVGDEVVVTVRKEVKSYASKQMDADYVATLTVAPEFTNIICEKELAVDYKSTATLDISVVPAEKTKGKKISVISVVPTIATVDKEQVVLDENGHASIIVNGELPGTGSLYLSMDDADLATSVSVSVVIPETTVKAPKASKRSGSTVEEGYRLTLTSDTPGATIYYTIDGTCPCEEQSRQKYTEPITLPKGEVVVNAIAVRHGMDDSKVSTFRYTVGQANIIPKISNSPLIDISYTNGYLVIQGAEGAKCRIYNLQGHELGYKQNLTHLEYLTVTPTDIYIVSLQLANGQTFVRKVNRR